MAPGGKSGASFNRMRSKKPEGLRIILSSDAPQDIAQEM
jgi:hypothetical protein